MRAPRDRCWQITHYWRKQRLICDPLLILVHGTISSRVQWPTSCRDMAAFDIAFPIISWNEYCIFDEVTWLATATRCEFKCGSMHEPSMIKYISNDVNTFQNSWKSRYSFEYENGFVFVSLTFYSNLRPGLYCCLSNEIHQRWLTRINFSIFHDCKMLAKNWSFSFFRFIKWFSTFLRPFKFHSVAFLRFITFALPDNWLNIRPLSV